MIHSPLIWSQLVRNSPWNLSVHHGPLLQRSGLQPHWLRRQGAAETILKWTWQQTMGCRPKRGLFRPGCSTHPSGKIISEVTRKKWDLYLLCKRSQRSGQCKSYHQQNTGNQHLKHHYFCISTQKLIALIWDGLERSRDLQLMLNVHIWGLLQFAVLLSDRNHKDDPHNTQWLVIGKSRADPINTPFHK